MDKDYSSISPSAQWLVALKASTSIPFAREAARLLGLDKKDFSAQQNDRQELFRLLFHFENRYQTIEKILSGISHSQLLEFSSGYSFRGLDLCLHENVHFIDTDLPGVIDLKRKLVARLIEEEGQQLKGTFDLMPLPVLNETEFRETVSCFQPGPVTLVNEGLLIYLDNNEKRQLCSIIHRLLKETGGCWITGDIYVRKDADARPLLIHDKFAEFRQQHKIDENKFESFEDAATFFKECGFKITQREAFAMDRLSCLDLLGERKYEVIEKIRNSPQSRETWMLDTL